MKIELHVERVYIQVEKSKSNNDSVVHDFYKLEVVRKQTISIYLFFSHGCISAFFITTTIHRKLEISFSVHCYCGQKVSSTQQYIENQKYTFLYTVIVIKKDEMCRRIKNNWIIKSDFIYVHDLYRKFVLTKSVRIRTDESTAHGGTLNGERYHVQVRIFCIKYL